MSTFNEDELRLPNAPLPPGAVLRLYSMRMCPYAQVGETDQFQSAFSQGASP